MAWMKFVFAGAILLVALALDGAGANAAYPGNVGRIAYTRTDQNRGSEIFSIAPDGTGEKQLTETEFDSCCPAWSPDGTQIAFFSNRDDNNDVYVMRADGSVEENVSHHDASEGKADWSPEGTKIAFASDRDGDFEIWVMNTDGTGAVQLTHNEHFNDYNPAWSPDGTKIAFERNPLDVSEGREVYIMDADGANQQNLTQNPAEDGWPEWAPDGNRLAFHTDRDGNYEVYSMAADGGDLQRLTDAPGVDRDPAWSPDGAKLAFSSNRSGLFRFQIYVLDLASTETVQITSSDASAFAPDWQPLSPIQGDVDCNGAVNAVDALGVLKDVAGVQPPAVCLDAGDVDCNGSRTAVDALLLLRYIAGFGPPMHPAEGCVDIGKPLP